MSPSEEEAEEASRHLRGNGPTASDHVSGHVDHGRTDGEAGPAEQSLGGGGIGSPALQGREQGWGREGLSSKAGVSEPGGGEGRLFPPVFPGRDMFRMAWL